MLFFDEGDACSESLLQEKNSLLCELLFKNKNARIKRKKTYRVKVSMLENTMDK